MPLPLAYLLTWTTYGSWLHGDERGSVDDQHNIPGEVYAPPDAERLACVARRQVAGRVTLNAPARRVIEQVIAEHCALRQWELIALHVRMTHVHVVVHADEARPETVAGQLKAWATRRLRAAGLFAPDAPIWTREASTRYLWYEASVRRALVYVVEHQGDELR